MASTKKLRRRMGVYIVTSRDGVGVRVDISNMPNDMAIYIFCKILKNCELS